MEFNEKLKQLRTKNDFTQEQLAEKLNISRVAVSKWESGREYPNLESLKQIAKLFGVTVDELLSSDQLIDIAESQTKNNSNVFRTLVFGVVDFLAVLLFVLPMFANRFEDKIDIVTIQNLTQDPIYTKVTFCILICVSFVFGFLELLFQNIQTKRKQKLELVFSGALSSLGIVISSMVNQPDPCIFFFALFLVKVLVALKSAR